MRCHLAWSWVLATALTAPMAGAGSPELLLADGSSHPGKIWQHDGNRLRVLLTRSRPEGTTLVPKLQSLDRLPSGELIVCSGLDRSILLVDAQGERTFHHGGYLARQVRVDDAGTLFWSGVETPLEGNPLPDGFIYQYDLVTKTAKTLLTFSQSDVGRDWWGAFDVHDGHIFVATLNAPARIYDVTRSAPVKLFGTYSTRIRSFRFGRDGSLWICDGEGRILRYASPQQSEPPEVILQVKNHFVDFLPEEHLP